MPDESRSDPAASPVGPAGRGPDVATPAPASQPMTAMGGPHPAAPLPTPPVPKRERPFARGFGLGTGAGLGVGVAVLILGVIGSIVSAIAFGAMVGAASSLSGSGQLAVQPMTTVWGKESATKTLRAIPVQGAIMADASDGVALTGGTYGYEVAAVLDRLTVEDADGVVLLLNTPGGSISGSRAMADAMDRYRDRTGHQVYAYVQGMSASGGMYTMAGADEILADYGSLIGSVGVIMGPLSQYTDVVAIDGGLLGTGVTTTGGITQEYLTAGRGKDAGDPYRPMTKEERATLQGMLDYEYGEFVSQVATKREIAASVMTEDVGAALLGTDRALEVGYIDGVMGRDEAFRQFAKSAGLDPADTKIVQSQAPASWWTLLGAEARPWGVAPPAQPLEGQPARATSTLCTGAATPTVWYGPTAGYCS
ncbi:MAG: S49 family peptidase [Propioniciclava sp.]